MKAHRKEIVGVEQGDKANANPQSTEHGVEQEQAE